jgi:hypothetical protein
MEPAVGALQFVWIAGHRRRTASHEDYFVELVEHLTAVTPDIDRHVARVIRLYRRHAHPAAEREADPQMR